MRPICTTCGKNYCAVNYNRAGVTHYRSMCDECGRKKNKLKPRRPKWTSKGYKKKTACDYAASKVYSLVKSPSFTLMVIWTTQKCLIYGVYVLTV